jgi:hypothetical protein
MECYPTRHRALACAAIYREAHTLLEELADATLAGTRKAYVMELALRPAADHRRPRQAQARPHGVEDLLELIMRQYERASTLLTSNRPLDDWASCSATPRR